MRKIILILLSISFYCSFEHASAQSSLSKIKKLLIGKWVLKDDKKYLIKIKEDSIIYYYNRRIKEKKFISFSLGDSLFYYKTKKGDFNFLMENGDIYPGIVIKECGSLKKNITEIKVVYIDKTGMDVLSKGRTATFNRVR